MSDAQNFLLTVDQSPAEASQIALGAAKKIESKETKLVEVVQSLGEYLTDDDATIRSKAVSYFAAVLAALDIKTLTRQQISVNAQFFCDRIQDASGLKEAASGLLALQRCQRFSGEHAVQIATSLFVDAQDLQQHPQGTRFVVLTLLDALVSDQRTALKGMSDDFVVGVTDLVSGEKDPRNLMIIFSVLRVVMIEWDVSSHVERMFDAVFCYFPITFRPPPDDPYGITSQDLKGRLRDCIAANSLFGGLAFPALLEKIDSGSLNVKRDVLQAIAACALSYDPATLSLHSTQLWDSLKFEIFNAQEEELASETLVVTAAIAQCLSSDPTASLSQSSLSKFLKPILDECSDLLKEPQQKQAKPAARIIGSVASASPLAFDVTIKSIMPSLLTLYQDSGEIAKQRALLEVLIQVFFASSKVYGTWSTVEPVPTQDNALESFKDRCFEIFTQALMGAPKDEVSFRMTAVEGLTAQTKIRNFLEEEEIGLLVQYYDEVILADETERVDHLKDAAISALNIISRLRPNLVMDITFPAFMATLPDSDPGHGSQSKTFLTSLESLAKLSVEKHLIDLLVRRLLNKLEIVLQNSSTSSYPQALISTLLYVLTNTDLENDPNLDNYIDRLVMGLTKRIILPMKENGHSYACVDDSILDVLGRLTNVLVRAGAQTKQQEVLEKVFYPAIMEDGRIINAPKDLGKRKAAFVVPTYIMAAVTREIRITPDVEDFLEQLVDLTRHETDSAVRLGLLRQMALATNKFLRPSGTRIEAICESCFEALRSKPVPESNEHNHLHMLLWLAKALLLRADKYSTTLLDRLLNLLAHPTCGPLVARGFTILLAPDDLLCKQNFAIIRLLHKQRAFNICVPKLSSDFRNADTTTKPNYLIALAGLLRWVPSEIVLQQLDVLLPLLLQSVDLPEAEVKAATIETLTVTVKENPIAIESHISSLITRLLGNSTTKSGSAPPVSQALGLILLDFKACIFLAKAEPHLQKVRLAALRCLQIFPAAFRHELLLPYKTQVSRILLDVLDDPKRHIRKEAVDCRSAWLRMDEPEEE
ncbi:MAG: hypothetical protein M4579_000738 [Chaenotheca gracillima]|nr:MAG: hypothetical protein M4579_000738 [Chaenotheca gracillima]